MPTLLSSTAAVLDAINNATPGAVIYLDTHSTDTAEGEFAPLALAKGVGHFTLVGRRSGSAVSTFKGLTGFKNDGVDLVTLGVRSPKVSNNPGILRFDQSTNISLRDCVICGVDRTPHGAFFEGCRDIIVEQTEFVSCYVGLTGGIIKGLTVSDCQFHQLRCDGLHGPLENVVITRCDFHDFYPEGHPQEGGDHPDAIQFYTHGCVPSDWDNYDPETGQGNPDGFEISHCRIWRGAGEPVQGVFFNDEEGNQPFGNVSVSRVGVFGSMIRAISMHNSVPGTSLAIDRCEAVSWPSPTNANDLNGNIYQPDDEAGQGGTYQITNCAAQGFKDCEAEPPEGCLLLDPDMSEQAALARQAAWMAAYPR